MSITAHPYIVVAEQLWKQESLSGANLAPRRAHRPRTPRTPRSPRTLRWPRWPRRARDWRLPRPLGPAVRTTPRPV
ncbi:hypothetical protein BJ986_002889 [Phycicoccus badiiscoriae]|uniref:Uncharacterized protein n=1 Tax=Pedococcus badiiscoriae TaxID=642776 RepID=A0A852WT77_9MICO|nr:hypothetical protein [Pedococcus badiiscoriae]NYG08402.1 hypothetical protein [Pedococcus badiiscoriae]